MENSSSECQIPEGWGGWGEKGRSLLLGLSSRRAPPGNCQQQGRSSVPPAAREPRAAQFTACQKFSPS